MTAERQAAAVDTGALPLPPFRAVPATPLTQEGICFVNQQQQATAGALRPVKRLVQLRGGGQRQGTGGVC